MEKKLNLNGVIYKITSPNNKVYIGQSINFEQRCRKYKYQAFKGQVKLWNNCQKYLWNPIDTIEIIEICRRDELDDRERFWISEFDSYNNGLNSDLGGKTRKGFKHSEETKEKLRIANTGNKHSDETKKKISEASKNMSDETKKKISDSRKGKTISDETKKKISEANTGNKLTDEQKEKISIANIGNTKRLGKTHTNETKAKIRESKIGISNPLNCKKIICINTGKIYTSQKEAAEKLEIKKPSSISRVCTKERKSYKGLVFMFYSEYEKNK
jgi:group I intron endonuclease